MNQKKKGLIILSCTVGFLYSGLLTFPEVSPDPHKCPIVTIDITYNVHKTKETSDNYYTIERLNGNYYSNGEWIDPQLICALAESFTDFYESKEYERLSTTRKEPGLIAEVTLENKRPMILKSGSRIHCFMPWNIEHNGKLYVQYSGKIPLALLQILIELDREKWYLYDKEAHWGCYPVVPPEKYREKGFSSDFPTSEPAVSDVPEPQILWNVTLKEPVIDRPQYTGRTLLVLTEKRLVSLEKTGKILWETHLEREGNFPSKAYLLVHERAAYIRTTYSTGTRVVKVDTDTGSMLWERQLCPDPIGFLFLFSDEEIHPLWAFEDNLLVACGGTICLDTKTGEQIWNVPQADHGWLVGDTFLFVGYEAPLNSCLITSYYGIIKIDTGEMIRKMFDDCSYCGYHDGILYFVRWAKDEVLSYDLEPEETESLYNFRGELPGSDVRMSSCNICEDGILLSLREPEKPVERAKIIFLDATGAKQWEYTYGKNSSGSRYPSVRSIEVLHDTLYLVREEGIVEAFNRNGRKLWEREVRGTVERVEIYDHKIYITADDCNLYCLYAETGEILWELTICDHSCTIECLSLCWIKCDRSMYVSDIGDGLIFVATENTVIAVGCAHKKSIHINAE